MVKLQTMVKEKMGDMIVHYLIDEEKHVEWMIYPVNKESKVTIPIQQRDSFSLVQAKIWKDPYDKNFSNGITMFNSATSRNIKFVNQHTKFKENFQKEIITNLTDNHNNIYEHHVLYRNGCDRLETWVVFINNSKSDERLDFLASITLNGLSPFYERQPSSNLDLIRLRSKWSMEGRLEQRNIEDYGLERSWKASGLALEKIEQQGTMPVRQFFPMLGLYDHLENVTWIIELDARASWQLNVCRIDDQLILFGGLPDNDSGNWHKNVAIDEIYKTPRAYLTVGDGKFNKVSRRLQKRKYVKEMPIVYNEWATTWGNPSEKIISQSLELLKNHKVQTYVIDAGWYKSLSEDFNDSVGNWEVDDKKFPSGLAKMVDEIHHYGMKAGIWYEFEGLGKDSENYHNADMLVTRQGWPVTTMKRRFLDLTKLQVKEFLKDKLVNRLKTMKFDYLKVDYNDSIGIGADGGDSEGEGVQIQTSATISIFKKLHREIPNLIIENCSSGGHRLVPPFIENSEVSSFSDAHETRSIPIIAANELNVLPPYKNLIWAVLNPTDSKEQMEYRLISTFLGRICMSGDIRNMSKDQWSIFDRAIEFYKKNTELIANGYTFRTGPKVTSYDHPTGYQICGFTNKENIEKSDEILMLIFEFDRAGEDLVHLPLLSKDWKVDGEFGEKKIHLVQDEKNIGIKLTNNGFRAKAILIKKYKKQ